ncbi:MAG: glycosyl transferase family 36 [Gemmataceae bacterium]|nr:glycosyl transferase family 36 [Gemmataceae bacterium]
MTSAESSVALPLALSTGPLVLPTPDGKEPIRVELHGLDALESHARELARHGQADRGGRAAGPVLRRLTENGRILAYAHDRINAVVASSQVLTPDAEWLLDNYYVVEEVFREVRHDLPRSYYRELPKLTNGSLAGYPRVYALALSLVACTDSSLDEAHITRFVQAYQTVTPLTIGELWAVPTMLRLVLLENLRRLAEQMLDAWDERRRAEAWIGPSPEPFAGRQGPRNVRLIDAFVVRSLEVLRTNAAPQALEQAEAYFRTQGLDVAEVIHREHQRQAVNQVSVGNCVTSLRLLAALDWGVFFETTSVVEAVLRQDPAGVYEQQDFPTRDRYRRMVEKLARRSHAPEPAVANRALERARQAAVLGAPPVARHIGHHLIGAGFDALAAELGYRPAWRDAILNAVYRHPTAFYFGLLAAGTTGLLAFFGMTTARFVDASPWTWLALVLAALWPASEIAVGVVNYGLTLFLPPRTLPKLAFKKGIAADCATFVVMPSMLARPQSAAALLERLEVHYLANPDPQLRFALLTDFSDAPAEHMPEDESYVRAALEGVAALNERYAMDGPPRFFLFHRRRLWNAAEGCWMGWERKRGKLAEFNRLLRGDRGTSHSVVSQDPAELPTIRYVITLDLDTQLPRDAARRLIGTLAHPLNQAQFDPHLGRVVEGYAVLQPRVSIHLAASLRTRFTRIWAASAGIDPYSTAVSDVYQDLFGAGTFTGKGIYDVDAFESATGQTFPENQVLSHDLIEGNYARCGLVTDIELFDDFPARYHAYARREHRWIRGDWQLLPWLGRRVPAPDRPGPGAHVDSRPNPLPALERWKVLDNLRRSLMPPMVVLWLVLSWTVLPLPLGIATAVAVLVLTLPLALQTFGTLVSVARGWSLKPVAEYFANAASTAAQVILSTAFLLNQAYLGVDAITRTLNRLIVTRRKRLEWETAASAERRLGATLSHFYRDMWVSVGLAVLLTALVGLVRPDALLLAGPFLLIWFLAPLIAWWVSQAPAPKTVPLSAPERRELGRIARKTWSFFETFVGAEDHWLPPDNYQEEPRGRVAHRTSPTNQGLLLLSTLSAHDFGYLSLSTLADRLEKTFDTLDRLERYRGHFYNWYDTLTLQPLPPAYVSTVDSGNLLGCLLALKQGLLEKTREPIIGWSFRTGLMDTLDVLSEALRAMRPPADPEAAACDRALEAEIQGLNEQFATPSDLPSWQPLLERLSHSAERIVDRARQLTQLLQPGPELEQWAQRLVDQLQERRVELAELAPWLGLLNEPSSARCDELLTQDPRSRERWEAVHRALRTVFVLAEFEAKKEVLAGELEALRKQPGLEAKEAAWLRRVQEAVQVSSVGRLQTRCQALAQRAEALAGAMNFRFLYKPASHLFAIGYHVPNERLDSSSYDLLASEARLASFLAIARGDAPREHWFHLGRALTRVGNQLCLLSWGGTMFEYLMPQLLLRGYPGTLVAESTTASVARQLTYGRERGVPWGVSESAYSSQYASFDYQYQSFGVPGLGLKRGLAQELVIAPYATALAVMVRPHDALKNLRRLALEGGEGRYGFYEAIDYTRSRLPEGRRSLVVRCFMAHHQGMSLVALANCLLDNPMPRRLHAEPMARATELLLQERVPAGVTPVETPRHDTLPQAHGREGTHLLSRRLTTPLTPRPRTHLLSNGNYSLMITNAGSGFSRCGTLDVTRWREDPTRDHWGQFCYVRDLTAGLLWSAGYQPVCSTPENYEVVFSADKAEIRRLDGKIASHMEVTVCSENCAEIRRVTLTNHDTHVHELELTSYAEIVLAPHGADLAHPAFGKLFVETEWVPNPGALLCRRRPRSPEQKPTWSVHIGSIDGRTIGNVQYETDRARFLGRGRTPADPAALERGAALSGTTGAVLDPIFSLRRRVRLEPNGSVSMAFCTALANSREEALRLADHYSDPHAVLRVFDLAWAHSQVELRHLQMSTAQAHLFQRLAAHLLYAGPTLRAPDSVVAANRQGQAGLWRYGISGDRPIILLTIRDVSEVPLVRQLLAGHAYLRLKGLEVDLVILCDRPTSYLDELNQQLNDALRSSEARSLVDKPGGVFLRQADQFSEADRVLLQSAARVVLSGQHGSLASQVDRAESAPSWPKPLAPTRTWFKRQRHAREQPVALPANLAFPNGLGGFTLDGREYCILVDSLSTLPPTPWSNVLANPICGFLTSESGLGPTWIGNSQLNRLTPWNNDPVSDPPAEVVYLRDEETGDVWTPTPRPHGSATATLVRHGQGYTAFQRQSNGLAQELLVFVPISDPLKLLVLKVRNTGDQPRELSTAYYAEWTLGTTRDQMATYVRTAVDAEEGVLLAWNPFNNDFGGQVAFADVNFRPRTLTADRTEFLGRNGSPATPEALGRVELSGRVGASLDPCAALHVKFHLEPGEEREVVFLLGATDDVAAARKLVQAYKEPGRARQAFDEVCARWDKMLTTVQVQTPDPALDLLLNRWLLYQVLVCRLWGRTALYQSGGAYGFRDQLQDVMALVHGAPEETRAHILRAAAHQFAEGDVQHWWHPPIGRGVRTRISDDYLWLPFVAMYYVQTTGDASVMDEKVPFLRGPVLKPGQEEDYGLPETSDEVGSVYEHCVRALRLGLRLGSHGLPLMGTGDWNDGMNRVGVEGKGESVWNGWFLLSCLNRFAEFAEARSDVEWADTCRTQAEQLRAAIEDHGWDGAWYRRAYFDDGTPLGSTQNDECRIDSIVQSWAVISGMADPARAHSALEAIGTHLVRPEEGLILLFTPPFDSGRLEPGYIKGYVPGIRENGGQYTHAATWVVQAAALLGQGTRAMELVNLLNPIRHTDAEHLSTYRGEPYVLAADVYSEPPHVGRGGWTWYTGSAGWLYRVVLEAILGFQLRGTRLSLSPCIPARWPSFRITYRYASATYQFTVENPKGTEYGVQSVIVDGKPSAQPWIDLADDNRTHDVRILMG